MALYNRYFNDYDNDINGGNEDNYHGEYDDVAYGQLYIPRMSEALATFEKVKHIFKMNNIGTVTSATFNSLKAPSTYRGKLHNVKQLYNAYVYVKWFDNVSSLTFRKQLLNCYYSKKVCLSVNDAEDSYWVVQLITTMSDELINERKLIREMKETATNVALRAMSEKRSSEKRSSDVYEADVYEADVYEADVYKADVYEAEQTATRVALWAIEEQTDDAIEELVLYEMASEQYGSTCDGTWLASMDIGTGSLFDKYKRIIKTCKKNL